MTEKPIVIFIHGKDSASTTWKKLFAVEDLKEKFHLFAIDLPGSGEHQLSIAEARRVYESHDTFASCLNDEINKLVGPSASFSICGHSMGARAAIIYANTYPQRIEHVVIEDMHFIRRSGVQSVTGDEKFEQFYGSVDEVEHAVAVYALDRVWVERKLEEGQVRELNEVEKAAGMPNARYYVGTNPLVTRLQFKLLMCECDERTLTAFGGKARSTTRIVLAMASKNAACNRTSDLAAMKAAVRDLIVVTVPDSSHSIHGTQCDAFAKLLIEQLP